MDKYSKGSCGEKVPKTGSLKRNKPTRGRMTNRYGKRD